MFVAVRSRDLANTLGFQFVSDQEHQVQLEPGRLLLYFSTDQGVTREQLGLELVRLDL